MPAFPSHNKKNEDCKIILLLLPPAYTHPQLWGGELELVVLCRLYERSIIIYNEANGLVHEQVFQASEDQASSSSQQHKPVSLPLKIAAKLEVSLTPKVYRPV